MMHIQRLTRPGLDLSLSELKLFLRVDHDDEDLTISEMADAVARELEDAAEIALINQTIRVTLEGWPHAGSVRLPIGPVLSDDPAPQVSVNGEQIEADLILGNRPVIILTGPLTEALRHARIVIEYQAGYGATAATLPPDIQHALRDQVAVLYDFRGANPHEGRTPTARGTSGLCYAMQRVIGRYRGVRA